MGMSQKSLKPSDLDPTRPFHEMNAFTLCLYHSECLDKKKGL